MQNKVGRFLFGITIIGLAMLGILCFMEVKLALAQEPPSQGGEIQVQLIQSSDDAKVRVISPQNEESIIESGKDAPSIFVGSTIEVLNGSIVVAYKEYTLSLKSGNKVVTHPTSILVEKGPVAVSAPTGSVTLENGAWFNFQSTTKSQE